MKKAIIYIFSIIPILGNSQSKAIFNTMEFDYKGEIESVFIESFKPITQHGKIIEYRYEGGLFGIGSQKIFFDESGKVSMKYEFETHCGGDSIQIDKIWIYYYSESRIDSVIRSESDTSLIRKGFRPWKFFYNYESDSVSYETSDLSLKRTSRIIKKENQKIREYLSKDSIVGTYEVSTYDTLGRLIKFEIYRKENLDELTILYYPDSISNEATISNRIKLKENQVWRTENEINEQGDIIKTTKFKPDGTYWTHWSFKYAYDDKGNWIKKEKYNYEERMLNMHKQTFEYKSSR